MGSHETTSYPRLLHSLKAAAASLSCDTAELLSFAAQGKIKLCARIPHELSLLDVDDDTLKLEKTNLANSKPGLLTRLLDGNGAVNVSDEVDVVILSKNDCKKIILFGTYMQGIFQQGYCFSDGTTSTVEPGRRIKLIRRSALDHPLFRSFATYTKELEKKSFLLDINSLHVTENDRQQFVAKYSDFLEKEKPSPITKGSENSSQDSIQTLDSGVLYKVRCNVLTDIIENAINQAAPDTSQHKIWNVLIGMATETKPIFPLLRYEKGVIVYAHGERSLNLNFKSFGGRVRRALEKRK